MRTLAYSLSSDEERDALLYLFRATADYVEEVVPNQSKQSVYAKTLLGTANAAAVDRWVSTNIEAIRNAETTAKILELAWPLFGQISTSIFFSGVEPKELSRVVAQYWINGFSYRSIFDMAAAKSGTRPWGGTRRKLSNDAIVSFLEGPLSFDCALIAGAILQLATEHGIDEDVTSMLQLFQKQLKYGLPDALSISTHEFGFADRVLAQRLRDQLVSRNYPMAFFNLAIIPRGVIREVVSEFPSYFRTVVATRDASL
jgi:hypothetical protein